MKANEYRLLDRCVEDGIQAGINRAYKHLGPNEQPSISSLKENIQQTVMLEISEWFDFELVRADND